MKEFFESLTTQDFMVLWPVFKLVGAAIAILVLGVFIKSRKHIFFEILAVGGCLAAIYFVLTLDFHQSQLLSGSVIQDPFSRFLNVTVLAFTILIILLTRSSEAFERVRHSEYYTLLLFSTTGMLILIYGNDLLSIFLGLEIMSISAYVLCGMNAFSVKSNEAS